MNELIQQELEQARAAIAAGHDMAAVEAMFRERTGLSMADAERQLQPKPAEPARGGIASQYSDAGRMAAQGLTFGFADELAGLGAAMIPGGKGYTEARDASRGRIAGIREQAPRASALAEAVGSLAVPFGAARAAGTLGRAALAGGATGAAGGALFGIGESEAPSVGGRLLDAVPDAAAGGLIGSVLGPVGQATGKVLARIGGSRGSRVARDLTRTSGIERDINAAIEAADAGIERVRAQFYRPLEAKFPVVQHPAIEQLLSSPDYARYAKGVVANKGQPSFKELQGLLKKFAGMRRSAAKQGRTDLVEKFTDRIDRLDSALSDAVEGYADANRAYAQARGVRRSIDLGRRAARSNWSAADVERALKELSPEGHEAFRAGQLHEIIRKLEQRDDSSVGLLRRYLDAGPETQAQLRQLFGSDESYSEFVKVLRTERKAERVARVLKSKWLRAGAAAIGLEKFGILDITPF